MAAVGCGRGCWQATSPNGERWTGTYRGRRFLRLRLTLMCSGWTADGDESNVWQQASRRRELTSIRASSAGRRDRISCRIHYPNRPRRVNASSISSSPCSQHIPRHNTSPPGGSGGYTCPRPEQPSDPLLRTPYPVQTGAKPAQTWMWYTTCLGERRLSSSSGGHCDYWFGIWACRKSELAMQWS